MPIFRREDNDELIEVDFATVMDRQDASGYLLLDDGVFARRCWHLEEKPAPPSKRAELDKPIVSDTLGFTAHQLAEFEADRRANGFSGIEFVQDRLEPSFYQVKCDNADVWRKYMKHRGLADRNSRNGGGAQLTPGQLDRLKSRMLDEYPADP